MTPTLYLVSNIIQEQEVGNHCFGDCGKIIVGAVDLGEMGMWFPCRQSDCPYEEKSGKAFDEPVEIQGKTETVFFRKLKSATIPKCERTE